MNFLAELFLAWRYFKPKRSAVSVITLISVIGVALGVCVLIVVLAIMTGFTDHLRQKLLDTGAHGQIQKVIRTSRYPHGAQGRFTENEAAYLTDLVKRHGGRAVPVVQSPMLLQKNGNFYPKLLLAFDPAADTKDFPLRDAVKRAAAKEQENARKRHYPARDFGSYSLNAKEILVSSVMADELGLEKGSKVILHTPKRLMDTLNSSERKFVPAEYTVAGVYTFDKYDFDKDVVFMGLEEADDLFGLDWGDSTHIFLWVDDPFAMDHFNAAMEKELSIDIRLLYRSWQDMHQQILGVLAVEKNMMFFLLIFIVLVAAFSISNTLITTVIQKTREIGLLKAMGTGSGAVMRIFIMQGLFVGLIGTAVGVLLGWLVVFFRMEILEFLRQVTGNEIFPKQMYLFSELPAHIVWSDVALISVISILLCTCGALLPAYRAARLDPARALRYE